MKKNKTLINGRSAVTKKSNGTATAFPDICKSPTPGGPLPIPFPNIAKSNDLKNGSKSVKVEGASVCLKGSEFSRSTGDEAGSAGGGIASGKINGKAIPLNYSFDVSIEGRPAVRNLDLFINNNFNTPPTPVVQDQVSVLKEPAPLKEEVEKCSFCGKPLSDCRSQKTYLSGNNIGNGTILAAAIFKGKSKSIHPWYTGPGSLEAHHLICSEAMEGDNWKQYCSQCGYDINRKQNGVMLPGETALACQLSAPLHRGNHKKGYAFDLDLNYPDAVMKKLKYVSYNFEISGICASEPEDIVQVLDDISSEILHKIDIFLWTLTSDGRDYQPGGNGCSGRKSITNKPQRPCPVNRKHQLTHFNTGVVIPEKSGLLTIGG